MDVDHEVSLLVKFIKKLGKQDGDKWIVKYGVLFKDDDCANTFEALVGTLKAAKKRGIVAYDSEILMSPMHDHIDVVLLKDA